MDEYLHDLAQGPIRASRRNTTRLLAHLRGQEGPKVFLGKRPGDKMYTFP
jgi:hypothetical protein